VGGEQLDAGRLLSRDTAAIAMPWMLVVALALTMVFARDTAYLPVVDDAISLALAAYAAARAAIAARAADGPMRLAWATLTAALVAWAIGDAIWLVYDVVLREPPSPSPADLFYLAFNILVAVGLSQLLATETLISRVHLALDALTVSLCLFLLVWIFSLNRVYDNLRDNNVELTLALITPLADVVVLSIAVLALARSRRRRPVALAVVTVAITLITIADVTLAFLIVDGNYRAGHFIDLVWAAAMALFAGAAVLSRRAQPAPDRPAPVPSHSSLWLPYVPLLLAGVLGPPVVMRGFESVLVQLVVVVVCARQILSAWDNRQLLTAAADQALRDPLTGLANRTLFNERLDHAMLLRVRDSRPITVISIDLDDFKFVNDSLGHPVADRLLVGAGQRFLECVRTGDTVARLGGDEFMMLLEGGADDHQMVAQRVVEAFERPFEVDDNDVFLRPSLGVATTSEDEPELSAEILMTRADLAMYAAKRSAADIRTFAADLASAHNDVVDLKQRPRRPVGGGAERIRLLGELRDAVDHRTIEVAYQPKVNLSSGRVTGVEALLRWPHPRLGTLRPDAFLSLVRQHGLMRPVSEIVVSKVLDDAADWHAQDLDIAVAINFFAPLLRDTRLPEQLCSELDSRRLNHDVLTVEITEDLVLTEVGTVKAVLRELRERGVRVAIDDFGSGYSALSYLRDLAVDEVKLDRQFVADVTSDPRAAAVVSAVINLTHTLGISVVAEGVEDAGTADWLTQHGCDTGQGFFFSTPVEPTAVPALLGRLGASGSKG
jgi:diguanylate cyclase